MIPQFPSASLQLTKMAKSQDVVASVAAYKPCLRRVAIVGELDERIGMKMRRYVLGEKTDCMVFPSNTVQ